jgi:hypothetical protein
LQNTDKGPGILQVHPIRLLETKFPWLFVPDPEFFAGLFQLLLLLCVRLLLDPRDLLHSLQMIRLLHLPHVLHLHPNFSG